MRTWPSGAAALTLLIACGGCVQAFADETVTTTEDIPVSGTPWIMVQTAGGSIDVKPGPDAHVHVEVKRRAPTADEAKALKVTARYDNGVVRIVWQNDGKPHRSVSFVVQAPAACRLALNTSGGAIGVDGFSGGVTANTSGGAITTRNLRGEVVLKTSGGSIGVEGVDGWVDARTSGGSVEVSGTLHGVNNLSTSGGGVRVRLSDKSKLRVDAATSGGGASNDFGWPVASGGFTGKIGDGSGGSLSAHTSGGSVSVGKL